MWVAHASALRGFGWYNEHLLICIYLCYHSCNAKHFMFVNRNMENHPGKQCNIWLCLGLLISELGVMYPLPDKGWGLTGSGVWTYSVIGVGLAKTR
jgi:hypothetical protein